MYPCCIIMIFFQMLHICVWKKNLKITITSERLCVCLCVCFFKQPLMNFVPQLEVLLQNIKTTCEAFQNNETCMSIKKKQKWNNVHSMAKLAFESLAIEWTLFCYKHDSHLVLYLGKIYTHTKCWTVEHLWCAIM